MQQKNILLRFMKFKTYQVLFNLRFFVLSLPPAAFFSP